MADYTLTQDADPVGERQRLARIEEYQDAATLRHLAALGAGPGWKCLDVGAGSGSIAAWLAEQVGPTGAVTATDLETGMLRSRCGDRVEVHQHDIRTDPLPDAAFDLVHCRLLLIHLPEREAVLARLLQAVRPGRLLVAGDIDFTTVHTVRDEPVFTRVFRVFSEATTAAGWALDVGARLPGLLERSGLQHVEGESYQNYHRGGSPAAEVLAMTFGRLRNLMLAAGRVSAADIDACVNRMHDPGFAFFGPTLWTAWGHRPAKHAATPCSAMPAETS